MDISTPSLKRKFNEKHFAVSAPRYDLVTRLLSFGQDKKWKRELLELIPCQDHPRCLDLACGTGDVTFAMAEKYPEGDIIGIDISEPMLEIARRKNRSDNVSLMRGELCPLEYPDESFDIITGSYALRNAPDLEAALVEIFRALKPGGIAAFLDFSKPENKSLQTLQYWTLKLWGGLWGWVLHRDPDIHGYISASLMLYPDRSELDSLFAAAGFEIVRRRRFFLGMTEAVILAKPAPKPARFL